MKKIIAEILILIVILSLIPCVFADGILDVLENSTFDRTSPDAWEDYVDLLLKNNGIEELGQYQKLGLGYYNFKTGEEYYFNGDEYMVAASLYKVPLNMIFADGNTSDAEVWGIKLSDYQYRTLHDSSNEIAQMLWENMGGYEAFKNEAKKYLGITEDEQVPNNFRFDNIFSARQFIQCLKILGSDSERFPDIIETMKITKEDASFKRDVQWCEIASKNGYYADENHYHTVVNDMGIVYTTQTFAIVAMTDNIYNANDVLADYCTLMCDYTNTRNYAKNDKIKELISKLDNF